MSSIDNHQMCSDEPFLHVPCNNFHFNCQLINVDKFTIFLPAVRSQMRAVFGGVGAQLTLVLLLISVHCLNQPIRDEYCIVSTNEKRVLPDVAQVCTCD